MRGVRLLPVTVVVLILLAVLVVAWFIEPQDRAQTQATRKTMQTVLGTIGGGALLWARRRSARRGAEVRRLDARPPVLLLRSFGDDMMKLEKGAKWRSANDLFRKGMTFERIVAKQLGLIGPVIAIGKPGESLAPLGAARDYVSDDVWQREVEERMHESTLIVLMLGSSQGLAWELLRAHRLRLLRKLVLIFPPAENLDQRWRALLSHTDAAGLVVLPDDLDVSRVVALGWDVDERPVALEGPRTEWAYETALRVMPAATVARAEP